jgi:hypothetical protein
VKDVSRTRSAIVRYSGLSKSDVISTIERPARQRHREIDFVSQKAEHVADALLAVDHEPPTIGRPIWTSRAPNAIGFRTSAPRRMPPSTINSVRSQTASAIAAKASMAAGAVSS